MLRELRVRNFAIIDDLRVEFRPGLNVLTGETGAGKSIIVGALGVALGQRAYAEMIKTGSEESTVEALFEVQGLPALASTDIDTSAGIVIRRNISRAGKTRAYLNDSMVTVQGLAEIGRHLVDIHGQHDHQSLLTQENQMLLLDHFGGLGPERDRVSALFEGLQAVRKKAADLTRNARDRAQRLDLLRYQIEEIDAAAPRAGEDLELGEERVILSNLSRLNELVGSAYSILRDEEGSCTEKLSTALSKLKETASIDQAASGALESLEQALPFVEDASISLRDLRDRYELDPSRLEQVEDRLEALDRLKKKYGDTIEDIIKYRDAAAEEVGGLEHFEETAGTLEKEIADREKMLLEAAAGLSEKRRKVAGRLCKSVGEVLVRLALEKSVFEISLKDAPPSSTGSDAVEFLFTANPGEAPKPLNKVASGGELSRVMLAIKSVIRDADVIPVLVFDEVDAGIGGRTAQFVARKLKDIARTRQVLCITHLPQIASAADAHYLIEKGEKGNRVYVNVKEISGKDRQEEIARMLSGSITDKSLEHAREIMEKTR